MDNTTGVQGRVAKSELQVLVLRERTGEPCLGELLDVWPEAVAVSFPVVVVGE